MDPEPNFLIKFIKSFQERATKRAGILDSLFNKDTKMILTSDCPICGNEPEPDCLLCDGTGELSSVAPDDNDDLFVVDRLSKK